MDIPFDILVLYIAVATLVGIIGLILGLKKVAGSPFIIMFASIMMFSLIVLVDDVQGDGLTGNQTQTVVPITVDQMNQPTRTGGTILRNGQITMFGEYLTGENSILRNKEINQATFRIDRIGSDVAGTVYYGVWGHNSIPSFSNAKFIIGQIRANDTDSDISFITLTRNDSKTYFLQTGDVVGVFFDNGDASNHITVDSNGTASSFDGTNTIRRGFSEATNTWTEVTTADMTGKVSLVQDIAIETDDPHDFNNSDTWAFMIVLTAFWFILGLMVQFAKW